MDIVGDDRDEEEVTEEMVKMGMTMVYSIWTQTKHQKFGHALKLFAPITKGEDEQEQRDRYRKMFLLERRKLEQDIEEGED